MDKVVHFELPADDVARAKSFYEQVFGWEIAKVPGMDYHMVTTVATDEKMMPKSPGAINGGLMKRNTPQEATVIVIKVASVEDYLKKVETAGGKMVMPVTKVGDMGLYARFADPDGNVAGLWQDLK